MDTYMSEHQDRSRNALQKAAEASFLAWCEELKADQAQFLSEKILCLDCASNTYFMPTVFEGSYAKITQTRRTFQRMNLYILVLRLPPLWTCYFSGNWMNVFYLSRAHTYTNHSAQSIPGWRRKGRKHAQSWSINLRTMLL